jgi:hypothetical protein
VSVRVRVRVRVRVAAAASGWRRAQKFARPANICSSAAGLR